MKNIYLNWCIDARRNVTLDDVYHPECGTYSFNCDKRLELDDICSLIARLPPNVAIPIQILFCVSFVPDVGKLMFVRRNVLRIWQRGGRS